MKYPHIYLLQIICMVKVYLECRSEKKVYVRDLPCRLGKAKGQRRPRNDIERKIPSLASRPSPPLIMLIILTTQVQALT